MLSPRQMFMLNNACEPIRRVFIETGDPLSGLYLVGSTMTGKRSEGVRDTDVRLMLSDGRYAEIRKVLGVSGLRFLGVAIGQYLASATGLPIDFQIQQTTAANEAHGSGWRNPLGGFSLDDLVGDGEPA